jgi:hypothetical protein
MITRRRAALDERNVSTSVICSGSAWMPSTMPSRCNGRGRAAVTRSPNAGRTGLKQVNVPAVATASAIGVASLYALSRMRARCVPSESKSIAQQAGLPYRPQEIMACVLR